MPWPFPPQKAMGVLVTIFGAGLLALAIVRNKLPIKIRSSTKVVVNIASYILHKVVINA
jgi:hypothetical protein